MNVYQRIVLALGAIALGWVGDIGADGYGPGIFGVLIIVVLVGLCCLYGFISFVVDRIRDWTKPRD